MHHNWKKIRFCYTRKKNTNLKIIQNIKVVYVKIKYKYLRVSWHEKTNDYIKKNHPNEFSLEWIIPVGSMNIKIWISAT